MIERDEIRMTNTNYPFSCAMNSIHMGYLFPITKSRYKRSNTRHYLDKNMYINVSSMNSN